MRILAIETSCDETAIAIADFKSYAKISERPYSSDRTNMDTSKDVIKIKVLSNIVLSQANLHTEFGGVVPNLAKREHQKNLVPILSKALKEAGLLNPKFKNRKPKLQSKIKNLNKILEREPDLLTRFKKHILTLKSPKIEAIAVTYGPGLEPALWVGINFAKALSCIWGKPIISVDHMKGHLFSAFLQKKQRISNFPFDKLRVPNNVEGQFSIFKPDFPALALLVSGGHTELVLMRGWNKFKIIGETLDDAAGEAFDKTARLLGLPYPGGPAISALTDKKSYEVQPRKISLPRPMINSKDFNFSFSGLKTAVLYLVRDLGPEQTKKLRPQIASEFQNAIVDVLISKTMRAAKKYRVTTIVLGGGVAANELLRKKLLESCELLNLEGLIVDKNLSGDNALMIAAAAFFSKKTLDKLGTRKTARSANLRIRAVGNLRLINH